MRPSTGSSKKYKAARRQHKIDPCATQTSARFTSIITKKTNANRCGKILTAWLTPMCFRISMNTSASRRILGLARSPALSRHRIAGIFSPFWSPDSRFIAFGSAQLPGTGARVELKKTDASGGPAEGTFRQHEPSSLEGRILQEHSPLCNRIKTKWPGVRPRAILR
jgi:hypothetical protein